MDKSSYTKIPSTPKHQKVKQRTIRDIDQIRKQKRKEEKTRINKKNFPKNSSLRTALI